MKKNKNILSEFVLKIIGYITMTIDHLGIFLEMVPGQEKVADICRCLGRIAFPLFVFMIVEGVIHTKHFGKYILRLGILAGVLSLGEALIYFIFYNGLDFPSPITDLVFITLTIYLINRKDKFSFLSILPIAYIVLCFVINMIEYEGNVTVNFLPFFLRCDYTIFGLVLALLYYGSRKLTKIFLKMKPQTENLEGTIYEQYCLNIFYALTVIFVSLLFLILNNVTGRYIGAYNVEFACFAAIPLLFYSGARGYNSKLFQYGCYLYFPLHLIILFAIFYFSGLLGVIL